MRRVKHVHGANFETKQDSESKCEVSRGEESGSKTYAVAAEDLYHHKNKFVSQASSPMKVILYHEL
jgi:hypothetical protein